MKNIRDILDERFKHDRTYQGYCNCGRKGNLRSGKCSICENYPNEGECIRANCPQEWKVVNGRGYCPTCKSTAVYNYDPELIPAYDPTNRKNYDTQTEKALSYTMHKDGFTLPDAFKMIISLVGITPIKNTMKKWFYKKVRRIILVFLISTCVNSSPAHMQVLLNLPKQQLMH